VINGAARSLPCRIPKPLGLLCVGSTPNSKPQETAGAPGERARLSTLSGKLRTYLRRLGLGRPVVWAAQQRWGEPVAIRLGGKEKRS
jgi:hypothetical protein